MLNATVHPSRFVAQFATDIKHISGQDNVVADALSRVESVTAPPSYDVLTASQDGDDELRTLLGSTTVRRLEKLPIPGTTVSIYCDTSAGRSRPYVPAPLRLQVFRPRSVAPRHQGKGKAGRAAFCVARCAEGLPHLGQCLPVLQALQSLPPYSNSIGRLYHAGSPLSACPRRPRWAPSDVSRLHILPHCSRPLHPLASGYSHP
jgi:hypothetical protein